MTAKRPISKLVIIVSAIIALMEIMVSMVLVISPSSVADQVDTAAKGVKYLLYVWASRQFALGIIFAYATFRRSASMLTICYLFFMVMMLGDIVIGMVNREYGMVAGAAVMAIIAISMMLVLRRKNSNINYGVQS